MSKERPAELWSDFDGTAVELVSPFNPRNWRKYPMEMIPGYREFLQTAKDEGLEIAGVVSRRHELRRGVTERAIADLGLDEFFHHPSQVVLAGSHVKKA